MLGQRQGDAVVEYALHVVDVGLGLVYGIGGEEAGGRHLLRVAHADEVLAACYGSYCLAGGHLRCLVEDDEVEGRLPEVDVLCHRYGAHEHAGAEPWQQGGQLLHDAAYADASPARCQPSLQQCHLGVGGYLVGLPRQLCGELVEEHLLGELLELCGQLAVAAYGIVEEQPVEHLQLLVAVHDVDGQPPVGAAQHALGQLAAHDGRCLQCLDGEAELLCAQLRQPCAPLCPVAHLAVVLCPVVDGSGYVCQLRVAAQVYGARLRHQCVERLQGTLAGPGGGGAHGGALVAAVGFGHVVAHLQLPAERLQVAFGEVGLVGPHLFDEVVLGEELRQHPFLADHLPLGAQLACVEGEHLVGVFGQQLLLHADVVAQRPQVAYGHGASSGGQQHVVQLLAQHGQLLLQRLSCSLAGIPQLQPLQGVAAGRAADGEHGVELSQRLCGGLQLLLGQPLYELIRRFQRLRALQRLVAGYAVV